MNGSTERAAPRPRGDPVIGLDVGGKEVYYCRRSTLLCGVGGGHNTSYFAGRFGPDSMMDPDLEYVDERGREVYFIDRDPELFKYVLEYLRTQELPHKLATFGEDPNLWRALRKEAEFFALDGLIALLQVTYSCSPDQNDNKGILYWLGTNKGRDDYINPYTRGAVDVSGWFDENWQENGHYYYGRIKCRELFIQYRPKSKSFTEGPGDESVYRLVVCDHPGPVVVDLRSVVIYPTHYSLRYGGCCGMEGDWNFEGSEDGQSWDVLHEARDDDNLVGMDRDEKKWMRDALQDTDEVDEIYCDYMERNHRHLWPLRSSEKFYRFFRIIGASPHGALDCLCLHAIGLEIFGHVSES